MRRLKWPLLIVGSLMLIGAIFGVHVKAKKPTGRLAAWVVTGKTAQCWPLAITADQQHRGLQNLPHPRYPLVFVFPQAQVVGFWMKNTPEPLTGAWVAPSGKVLGRWHGTPESARVLKSPGVVSVVIEYPAGWKVPAVGSTVLLARNCQRKAAL